MSEPRWTNETVEAVALAMAKHHLDPNWTDADRHSRCVCERWVEGEMEPSWDDHMAEVALAALADAGLLVEPGGETRTVYAVRWSDSAYLIPVSEERARREVEQHAPTGARLMSRTIHTGPWREAQ